MNLVEKLNLNLNLELNLNLILNLHQSTRIIARYGVQYNNTVVQKMSL